MSLQIKDFDINKVCPQLDKLNGSLDVNETARGADLDEVCIVQTCSQVLLFCRNIMKACFAHEHLARGSWGTTEVIIPLNKTFTLQSD